MFIMSTKYKNHIKSISQGDGFNENPFCDDWRSESMACLIHAALHPALITFYPFSDLKCSKALFITSAWMGFNTDSLKATFIVVTSQ